MIGHSPDDAPRSQPHRLNPNTASGESRASNHAVGRLFMSVVVASAPLVGQTYFSGAPAILAEAWGGGAFITHIDARGDGTSCQLMGAAQLGADLAPGHPLPGQPWCGEDNGATVYHPAGVGASYPDDELLAGAEVFCAVPLVDSHGRRIGYIGMTDRRQWEAGETLAAESLLRLMAPRAAAELERHSLHERLMVQLRNFRALADETGEGFLIWSGELRPKLVSANAAFERLTGYDDASLPKGLEDVVAGITGAMRTQGTTDGTQSSTIVFRRPDGEDTTLEATLTADRSRADEPIFRCILREPRTAADVGAENDAWLGAVLRELPFAAIVLAGNADEVVFMNPRAREVTGATQEDVLDRIVVLNEARRTTDITLREFGRRALSGRTSATMLTLRLPKGRERVIQMRMRRLTLRQGPALLLAPLDLTQERLAQHLLEERAEVQGRMLSSLPADMVAIDGAGRVIAVSNALSIQGRRSWLDDAGAVLHAGDDFFEVWRARGGASADIGRRALRGIGAVLSRSMPEFAIQYEVSDSKGIAHWMLLTALPLDGEGALITHSEITALKRDELDMAAREARTRELLQNFPDQLARISRDGHVHEVLMPGSASRMVAPLPRAPMGRSLTELLATEAAERLLKAIRDAIRANAITSLTVSLPYGEEEREYEMRVVPTEDHESLVYVRDRTADQWSGAPVEETERGDRRRIVRENAYGLTFREVAVLELMAQGASDKEIAATLGVSVFTVYKHVSKILHKMNAASRTEASLRTVREHMFG